MLHGIQSESCSDGSELLSVEHRDKNFDQLSRIAFLRQIIKTLAQFVEKFGKLPQPASIRLCLDYRMA